MRASALCFVMLCAGCGDADFVPPPRDDMKISIDLASSVLSAEADMSCLNTACGGCSSFANRDGTPASVGDPCLWKGVWQCSGDELECSDNSCPSCGTAVTGTVCGADGHTILELTNLGNGCRAYDFGSAIDVCDRGAGAHCGGRCTLVGGAHQCVANCVSDDGGGTGCAHQPPPATTDTCESLTSC